MHLVHTTTVRPPTAASHARATPAAVMSEHNLCDRLADALPGDVITYHIGLLARDRAPQSQMLSIERCRELGAVADRALRLAESGWAHLVQRRIGEECFAYLLIVRPRPRRGTALPAAVALRQAA
ncbi:hypothetical protein [Belnapia rosea]|uniref:Uncharacterized protein n=1 Tax=Belnapia rosea TaxID=938405 RepID=A0A1G6RNT8_9PROT|nr:hypothetical protein [Belnapia rosea]SDD06332.1 hypothetical protein SAMN04487779_100482 [Belnapia rosea]